MLEFVVGSFLPWLAMVFVPLLIVIYQRSIQGRFLIRMTLYYLSTLVAGSFAAITSIPTYFQNRGGIYAFKTHQFFSLWTGIKVEVRGKEKLEGEGQAVIIANHQSSLDIIPMARCWPERCTVMMKRSLKYVPGFNIAAILGNTIFVDRMDRERAKTTIEYAVGMMKEKNLKLWVFPEGSRSASKEWLPFKRGAFNIAVKGQIPVIPVVISCYLPFYSKESRYFHDNGQVIAQVLDPISTEGLTEDDVPELINRVRSKMLETYEKISLEAAERQAMVNSKCEKLE